MKVLRYGILNLTSSGKFGGLPVSAGVQTSAEMLRSGNEVMSK